MRQVGSATVANRNSCVEAIRGRKRCKYNSLAGIRLGRRFKRPRLGKCGLDFTVAEQLHLSRFHRGCGERKKLLKHCQQRFALPQKILHNARRLAFRVAREAENFAVTLLVSR